MEEIAEKDQKREKQKDNYIHPKVAWEKLRAAGSERQDVYMSGAMGYGKTELVRRYLRRRRHVWLNGRTLSAEKLRNLVLPVEAILTIDDLPLVTDPDLRGELLALLENPDVWVILISTCPLPGWLNKSLAEDRLCVIQEEDLMLSADDLADLFLARGVQLPRKLLEEKVFPKVEGNALAALQFASAIESGDAYTPELLEQTTNSYWSYLCQTAYDAWDGATRDALMQLSIVDSFTVPMAEIITGRKDINRILRYVGETGQYFTIKNNFYFMRYSLLQSMRWRLDNEYDRAQQNSLLSRAGLAYEKFGKVEQALRLYETAGDRVSIKRLLIETAHRNSGSGYYYELRRFYLAMPEDEVRSAPELIAAMSMMHSLMLNSEESERWYQELQTFAARADGEKRREALSWMVYLDISLPHRGSANLDHVISDAVWKMVAEKLEMPELSVTDALPSVINGAKDFADWVKDGTLMVKFSSSAFTRVLGSYSKGLASLVRAEMLFETGEEPYQIIELANRGIMETLEGGKMEMQFVGVGIIARTYLMRGNIDEVWTLLDEFDQRAHLRYANRVATNLGAMRGRLMLYQGNVEDAVQWMSRGPSDDVRFNVMDRYCYMTRVRVYIVQERYDRAIGLLARMQKYADSTGRTWLQMECALLSAIIHYRTGESGWRQELMDLLERARPYRFVRLFSREGAALDEMLRQMDLPLNNPRDFVSVVARETHRMADLYPSYLCRGQSVRALQFKEGSLQVLRMQAMGMTRSEIALKLGRSERSVKYQSEQVYRKLGVNNKVEAIEAARKLNLL